MLLKRVRAKAHVGLSVIATALSMMLSHAAGAQVVRYVDADARPGGDGTTWMTAFNDLQAALAAANADPSISQLWIAEGTYKPAGVGGPNSATFQLRSGLALYGGFDGTETSLAERDIVANVTTLSGDLNGDDPATFNGPPPLALYNNAFHLVTGSGVDASARLDGLTLRGGAAHGPTTPDRIGVGLLCIAGTPTIAQCSFVRNFSAARGGAVYCADGSHVTFTDCIFDSNRTTLDVALGGLDFGGGAIYLNASDASISNCVFQNNAFAFGGSNGGGAVLSISSSPTIADCAFISNGVTPDDGSGGGAIRNVESTPVITNCTFTGNRAAGGGSISNFNSPANIRDCLFERGAVSPHALSGGGMSIVGDASPTTIVNCVFDRLSAESSGAIAIGSADPLIINCRFVGNSAYLFDGGAVRIGGDAAPTFVNCAFSGNSCTFGVGGGGTSGAIRHNSTGALLVANSTFTGNDANPDLSDAGAIVGSNVTLRNCIVVHNTPGQLGSSVTATYSCVQGGWPGTGNIDSSNPGFVDEDGADDTIGTPDDDVRLIDSSPCIDAARNDDVPADLADLDGDGNTAEPTPLDLALGPRFYDHAATPDTGSGTPPIVDMGAHEFRLLCEGDANSSGAVDVDDLIAVILGWGACPDCPPNHCATDIAPFPSGNCATDVDDLIAVILHWGACR